MEEAIISTRDVLSNDNQLKADGKNNASENGRPSNIDDLNDAITRFIQFLADDNREAEEIKSFIIKNLMDKYSKEGARHSYFRISAVLQELRLKDYKKLVDTSVLESNLEILAKDVIIDPCFSSVHRQLYKFYDHCKLEISRYNYFDSIFWKDDQAKQEKAQLYKDIKDTNERLEKTKTDINNTNKRLEKTKTDINNTNKRLEKTKTDIDNTKSEQITILSIFAAIMLASLGGLGFLNSAIDNIEDVFILHLIAICCICGFVLFNTTFMLIYMAARITERSIYSFCSSANNGEDCTKSLNKCNKDCNELNRLRKRLPYVFWVNCVLSILFILDIILWVMCKLLRL